MLFILAGVLLPIMATSQNVCYGEATATTGCDDGFFYTPATTSADGSCAACTTSIIANAWPYQIFVPGVTITSCADGSAKSKVTILATGVEATATTGCDDGFFYTPATTSADGSCAACATSTAIANGRTEVTKTSCADGSAKSKLTMLATGVEATATTGCDDGFFYTPATASADGSCAACATSTPIANGRIGTITTCADGSAKSKLTMLATGVEATATTGCDDASFYTPATASADGSCAACTTSAPIADGAGYTTCADGSAKSLLQVPSVCRTVTSSASATATLSGTALLVAACFF